MHNTLTEIAVVLDRSGSMESSCTDTIGGFNAFLAEQVDDAGEVNVTLTQFDNEYEVLCLREPIRRVPRLTLDAYVPRGNTALLDAIDRTDGEGATGALYRSLALNIKMCRSGSKSDLRRGCSTGTSSGIRGRRVARAGHRPPDSSSRVRSGGPPGSRTRAGPDPTRQRRPLSAPSMRVTSPRQHAPAELATSNGPRHLPLLPPAR